MTLQYLGELLDAETSIKIPPLKGLKVVDEGWCDADGSKLWRQPGSDLFVAYYKVYFQLEDTI